MGAEQELSPPDIRRARQTGGSADCARHRPGAVAPAQPRHHHLEIRAMSQASTTIDMDVGQVKLSVVGLSGPIPTRAGSATAAKACDTAARSCVGAVAGLSGASPTAHRGGASPCAPERQIVAAQESRHRGRNIRRRGDALRPPRRFESAAMSTIATSSARQPSRKSARNPP